MNKTINKMDNPIAVLSNNEQRPSESSDVVGGKLKQIGPLRWKRRLLKHWGLLLSIEGQGKVLYNGHELTVEPRELLIYKPDYPYVFFVPSNWHYLWFHYSVREHMSGQLGFTEVIPGLGRFSLQGSEYRKALRSLLEAWTLDSQNPYEWSNLVLLLLETTLQRVCYKTKLPAETEDARVKRAIHLLSSEHCGSMKELARLCNISEPLLYILFRKEVGCSPLKYKERHLLRKAQALLQKTDLSIGEIAAQLEMHDQYYFSRKFKKLSGMTPSGFRKKHRNLTN